jgi:hypothetical protein
MLTRRTFLNTTLSATCASLLAVPSAWADAPAGAPRKKLAIIGTEFRMQSHMQHMGDRFLTGYPLNGTWHSPQLEVVSMYVDQTPASDLSRQRAAEYGFKIYPTIAQALRCGGDKLAVDAVLTIGEHGNYPLNEIGRKLYPRFEFFKQATDVFRKDGRSVPYFNDKHLSWKWEWAKEMVDTSHELGFPMMAGSSLPVTWRMPSIDMPWGAEVEEVLCVGSGAVDVYDFHALEMIQCMAERRRGGETGVAAVQGLRGDNVWAAMKSGSWAAGGWDPQLFEACLCRSQTLGQAHKGFGDRHPTVEDMHELVKDPIAYRFEYRDGLKATMLLMSGLVHDLNFAARIKGQSQPLSTLFYLPPDPNVAYSGVLMSKVESMFLTGKPAYPVERTLLTTGLVAAGMESLASGQKRMETPHLAIRYEGPRESVFART